MARGHIRGLYLLSRYDVLSVPYPHPLLRWVFPVFLSMCRRNVKPHETRFEAKWWCERNANETCIYAQETYTYAKQMWKYAEETHMFTKETYPYPKETHILVLVLQLSL